MALQFILGLFILRTKVGFMIFDFLGDLVQTFLDYTDEGAIFVFGDNYMDHFFAFKVRSTEDGEEGNILYWKSDTV